MNLRNKILGVMSLTGILPLVILGILALLSLNYFHRVDVETIENNLLSQKIEEIEGFLESVLGPLELQVGFEQVSDIELGQQYFLLQGLLTEVPALEEAAFLNLAGEETSLLNRRISDPKNLELRNQADSQKFLTARGGQGFIGRIYSTPAGPTVTLAAPVRNRGGAVISVLSAEANLSELQKILQKSRLGDSGYVYALDKDGYLIAHSEPGRSTGAKVSAPAMQGIARYQSFWNEPVVAESQIFDKLDLRLVAEWPAAEADLVVNTIKKQITRVSILVLAGILLLSVLLANRIIKPIRVLEQGAKSVSEGKFDKPVSIKTGDEIEELGTAFNEMIKGLKKYEELKDEFVFVAAHELRTPVTAIKGYLSMVTEGEAGPVSAEVKELIDQVVVANARLVQLVEDLLQVARNEAGRLEINVSSVDVAASVREVTRELLPLANEKQIKLVYEPGPASAVLADSGRLREILVNLVGNAIKYTPGPGTVTIFHEPQGKTLVTHIKDTGLGISAEAQQKLFEKFYRVRTEDTAKISGTGLGLFIVKQIVEKMNGKIWIASEPGKGSTFSFSLELA